jgi:hypothetical protein
MVSSYLLCLCGSKSIQYEKRKRGNQMNKTRVFSIVLCFCVVVFLIACPSGENGKDGDEIPFADKVWGTAQLIEMDNNDTAWYPQVGLDGSGNAVAVWRQFKIWSNRYVAGTGWGTAQLIETDSGGATDPPQVGVVEMVN